VPNDNAVLGRLSVWTHFPFLLMLTALQLPDFLKVSQINVFVRPMLDTNLDLKTSIILVVVLFRICVVSSKELAAFPDDIFSLFGCEPFCSSFEVDGCDTKTVLEGFEKVIVKPVEHQP
jgi:hypothetical protein